MGGILSRSILYEELLEITISIFKLNRRLRIAEQLTVGYGGGGIVGTEIGTLIELAMNAIWSMPRESPRLVVAACASRPMYEAAIAATK